MTFLGFQANGSRRELGAKCESVEGLNVIKFDPKCNKFLNVITFSPKCNKPSLQSFNCPCALLL